MIVITGATGALNGATTEHLLATTPPERIAVVARDPARASSFADRGVEVRSGDYAAPETLAAAFADAEQLLLVSSNDPTGDAVALHRTAIDAAVDAGVGRILYTSHQGASPRTPFGPGRDHAATESLLAESGVPWTSLRNGFYLHSLGWLLGPWRETGEIVVPVDGPVSWTDRADEAEAAASIIRSEGAVDGAVTLTASEAPTFGEIARIVSELEGRHIGFRAVGEDEWVAAQVAAGRPEAVARFTLGMYEAAAGGFFAGTDPLLGTLLGRAPRSVRDELAAPSSH